MARDQFVDDQPHLDWLGGDGIVISDTGGEISFEGSGDVEIHESTNDGVVVKDGLRAETPKWGKSGRPSVRATLNCGGTYCIPRQGNIS